MQRCSACLRNTPTSRSPHERSTFGCSPRTPQSAVTKARLKLGGSPMRSVLLATAIVFMHANAVHAESVTLIKGGEVRLRYVDLTKVFGQTDRFNTVSIISPVVRVAESGCEVFSAPGLPGVIVMSNASNESPGCEVRLDSNPDTPEVDPFPAGTTFEFAMMASGTRGGLGDIYYSDDSKNHNGEQYAAVASFPECYDSNLGYGGPETHVILWADHGDVLHDPTPGIDVDLQVKLDSDEDGLWDNDELGIDTDGDQTIDIQPWALGARPWKKDVFVHVDYMDCNVPGGDCPPGDTHSHRPKDAAIEAVRQAFLSSPAMNPRNGSGIELHVEIGQAIPHHRFINFEKDGKVPSGSTSFAQLKDTYFAPDDPGRWVYHYCIFGHEEADSTGSSPTGFSGRGEQPGDDFFVTLGASCTGCANTDDVDKDGTPDGQVGTVAQQASSFMHELGHNLGLGHGGGDGVNGKPNYMSLMNYDFYWGIPPVDPDGTTGPLVYRLDYSRTALSSLNEASLDENAGIGDGTDDTYYHCGTGTKQRVGGSVPIDWDCNGTIAVPPVKANINGDCSTENGSCGAGALPVYGVLVGHDDWQNLNFRFHSASDYPSARHLSAPLEAAGSGVGPPLADAGMDISIECGGHDGTEVDIGIAPPATGVRLSYTWTDDKGQVVGTSPVAHVAASYGPHAYTLRAEDPSGNAAVDQMVVTVIDTQPPDLSIRLTPSELWPPSHGLATIQADVRATDICDESPSVKLVSITSNEADEDSTDIVGASLGEPDFEFQLRSERLGTGGGREYSVCYQAEDEAGNQTRVFRTVGVPHDMSRPAALEQRGAEWSIVLMGSTKMQVRAIDPSSVAVGTTNVVRWAWSGVPPTYSDANGDGIEDAEFKLKDAQSIGVGGGDIFARWEVGQSDYEAILTGVTGVDAMSAGYQLAAWPGFGTNGMGSFIRYTLPRRGKVTIRVFDASGRLVRQVEDGIQGPGPHRATVKSSSEHEPSGILFYKLEYEGRSLTGKLLILN